MMKRRFFFLGVGLVFFIGCKPSTPEKLIKRFDSCFIQYAQHSRPYGKIRINLEHMLFQNVMGVFPELSIEYYYEIDWSIENRHDDLYYQENKNGKYALFEVIMFSPGKMNREQLIAALEKEYLTLSPNRIRNHYYYFDKGDEVPEWNMAISYYNEVIYIFSIGGYLPENQKILLDRAFSCIDEATGNK